LVSVKPHGGSDHLSSGDVAEFHTEAREIDRESSNCEQ